MFYKLSNTCDLKTIESEFGATFRFPNLYEPISVIDGTKESNLPIITSLTPNTIDYAIWGLLPEDYDEDWDRFQNITNTLNTSLEDLNSNKGLYKNCLTHRRCLIIVNGFFTSSVYKGKLYPFHVHLKNHNPFCIAGIYNTLDDGFLTCSILVSGNNTNKTNEMPNINGKIPIALKPSEYDAWLSNDKSKSDLKKIINTYTLPDLISHPIKKDFYKNNGIYEQILDSNDYQNI